MMDTFAGIKWTAVILVKSAVGNFYNRHMQRSTWARIGYINDMRLHTVFIVGKSSSKKLQPLLEEESAMYGDILQCNYTDGYK